MRCQAPHGTDGTKRGREREREKIEGGTSREATREVCDTSLFSAAHTKAAYYLILHTTDRGIGMVRKAERKQRHTVDARKGEGAIVIIARVAFCWQEHKASLYWGSDGTALSLSAKPDSARAKAAKSEPGNYQTITSLTATATPIRHDYSGRTGRSWLRLVHSDYHRQYFLAMFWFYLLGCWDTRPWDFCDVVSTVFF